MVAGRVMPEIKAEVVERVLKARVRGVRRILRVRVRDREKD